MAIEEVRAAYGARAKGVVDMLGTEVAPHDPDRVIIESWAETVPGRILDVGSGTGRWSGHLASLGYEIEGLEPVTEFVEAARLAHPSVSFRVGSMADLEGSGPEGADLENTAEQWSGILAWYSLIHLGPADLPDALATLREALENDGTLLLSFFSGPRLESFDHPVTRAYRWPMKDITRLLTAAGFDVTSQFWDPPAPHAVIVARAVR